MRSCFVFLWIALVCNVAWSAADYDKLSARAERFVQFQEWNSAQAMYLLMINERPNEPKPYSRAIVMSGLLNDEPAQVDLLEKTQKRGIPLDSIFTEVYDFSFEVGESQEYESFLNLVKKRQPWMSRHINVRLLKYYDFRNDAENVVAIGKELLETTPDDINYLLAVARGLMLLGNYEAGELAYRRVLLLDEQNYDALLALGNYYYVIWKSSEGTRSQMSSSKVGAVKYLQKAYNINPTPFVSKVLTELEN